MKQLGKDITNLRGECILMSERVTNLTGGKGKKSTAFFAVFRIRIRIRIHRIHVFLGFPDPDQLVRGMDPDPALDPDPDPSVIKQI